MGKFTSEVCVWFLMHHTLMTDQDWVTRKSLSFRGEETSWKVENEEGSAL